MAGVRTTHKDYDRFSPKWKRARDVVAGQDAVHEAKTLYLPKLHEEDDDAYKARVKRSDFFNGTWRTIDGLLGMAFRKPPTVEIPKGIEPYFDDVTLSGVSMEAFAKETLEEDLSLGRIGILVDHPLLRQGEDGKVVPISVLAAEKLGQRPTLKLYTAESIRNWKFGRVNNAWVLVQVRLGETASIPKDEWEETTEERIRVLELDESGFYRQRLFRIDKDGKEEQIGGDIYPLKNNQPLTAIPFFIVGANGKGDCIDEPPLIDLIDKNVAHYQVNSDYRHGLHFTGLPTLFLSGIVDETNAPKFYIGSSAAVTSPFPEARGEYVEFKGQGLGAIENALDRIEKQMALLGARMIADETKQVETLGATQIKRAGENSVLAKIVQAVSEALEEALTLFADWAGHPDSAIVYQINRDFMPAMMDAQTLSALFAGVMSGNISKQEMFTLLQRGDLIDGEVTYEEHQAQVEISTPSPARPTPKEPGAQAA